MYMYLYVQFVVLTKLNNLVNFNLSLGMKIFIYFTWCVRKILRLVLYFLF